MSKLLFYLMCLDFTLHCSSVTYGPKFKDLRSESPRARCDSFSKFARFQPYSVLDEQWKIFYYWGSRPAYFEYVFRAPSIQDTSRLHTILDGNVEVPVNWTARQLLIEDSNKKTSLLVELNDRGRYNMYRVLAGPQSKEKILHLDIRIKQKSGYIGIMFCNITNVYVLARKSAVPRKNKILEAAATMDVHMRGGQSYLYRGHHWMPVGEADDDKFFLGDGEDDSDVQQLVVPDETEEEEAGEAGREEFVEDITKSLERSHSGKEEL